MKLLLFCHLFLLLSLAVLVVGCGGGADAELIPISDPLLGPVPGSPSEADLRRSILKARVSSLTSRVEFHRQLLAQSAPLPADGLELLRQVRSSDDPPTELQRLLAAQLALEEIYYLERDRRRWAAAAGEWP